jgi:hypothetical protein
MIDDTNIPTITIDSWGETTEVHPRATTYENGRLCLELWIEHDEGWMEPFAKVTTNLPDQHLNEGEIFVKDWAENEPMVAALLEAGWLVPAGREVLSGYVAPAVMRPAGALAEFLDKA